MSPAPIKKLSSRGGHFVSLLLAEHCTTKNGAALYAEGWSDLTIAAEAERRSGDTVTAKNVAYVRLAVYGQLRRTEPEDPDARISALEKRVSALEGKVEEALGLIASRFDALEGAVLGPNGDLFTAKTGGAHVNGRV